MKKFDYITPPNDFLQIPIRFLSTLIVKRISKTNITPNQLTISRGLMYIVVLFLFALGDYRSLIIAFILFQIGEVLDHVDGDLARHKNMTSKMGELLDCMLDIFGSQASNLFGLCVAIGVYRHTDDIKIFYVFFAIVLGRLIWTEFRDPFFQWHEKQKKVDGHAGRDMGSYLESTMISSRAKLKRRLARIFLTILSWQNQLILWGALFYYPIERYLHINPLFWAMVIIALLNHFLWIVACISGFSRAFKVDKKL